MKNKKIFIYAKGSCWKRQLDAGKMFNYLSKNGYEIVKKPGKSDIILFVTCAFLNGKLENSLKKVKEFQKYNAELIVAGCLPVTGKSELSEIFNGKIITTKDLDKDIEKILPPNLVKFKDVEDANLLLETSEYEYDKKIKKREFVIKTKISRKNSVINKFSEKQFHIRVSWGCTGNCSYCTIKDSTGKFRSKPFDECIKEFKKGLEEGYKNFVLDGTDVGAYGIDIGSSFSKLLDELTKNPNDYYITIRELHPKWIYRYIDEIEEIVKRNKILVLDVAIQSTNDRVLKMMNRPTDVEKMRDAFKRLKKANPDLWITCEFILGFPTETEEEFNQSLTFIKDLQFNGGQIYSFSCRKGTEAEKIEPKLTEEEMLNRMKNTKKFLKNAGYKVITPDEKFLVFREK